MEQSSLVENDDNNILSLGFNQDYSYLGMGHKHGYKFFSFAKLPEQMEETYSHSCDGVHLVERLFQSSLVTLCTQSSPRKMRVFHMRQKDDICAYNYSNAVLAIRMNRLRLVVVLEDSIQIHHIRDLQILHAIRDTPRNPTGLSALSPNTENCYLAYPGSATIGEVQIFDASNLSAVTMIPAHEHPLTALAFDSLGTRLATASNVGTVIRLFAVPSGVKLGEFSRGLARSVVISSLAFSTDSRFLAVSSNTETVHVFQVADAPVSPTSVAPEVKPQEETPAGSGDTSQSWGGYFSRVLRYPLSYLPTPLGEVWNRDRDFATARLPRAGVRNVCAILSSRSGTPVGAGDAARELFLLVASLDGLLFCFKFDAVVGGECTLVNTFRLDENIEGIVPSPTSTATPVARHSDPVAVPSGGALASPTGELFAVNAGGGSHSFGNVSQSPPSSVPSPSSRASSKSYADAVGSGSGSGNSPPTDFDASCQSSTPVSHLRIVLPIAKDAMIATRKEGNSGNRERERLVAKNSNESPLNLLDPNEFPPFTHQVSN